MCITFSVSSEMICYVIFFCVMLDLCSVIHLAQVRHLFSLHLKIPKRGVDWLPLTATNIGDGLSTSSYPAITHYPVETQQPS